MAYKYDRPTQSDLRWFITTETIITWHSKVVIPENSFTWDRGSQCHFEKNKYTTNFGGPEFNSKYREVSHSYVESLGFPTTPELYDKVLELESNFFNESESHRIWIISLAKECLESNKIASTPVVSSWRFKTKEEFISEGRWEESYGAPTMWNSDMNFRLGQPITDANVIASIEKFKYFDLKNPNGSERTYQPSNCTQLPLPVVKVSPGKTIKSTKVWRFKVKEEFIRDSSWNRINGVPKWWNPEGDMNKYLGVIITDPKQIARLEEGKPYNDSRWSFRYSDFTTDPLPGVIKDTLKSDTSWQDIGWEDKPIHNTSSLGIAIMDFYSSSTTVLPMNNISSGFKKKKK